MNVPNGLACCKDGPAGCGCYVTIYVAATDEVCGLCVRVHCIPSLTHVNNRMTPRMVCAWAWTQTVEWSSCSNAI